MPASGKKISNESEKWAVATPIKAEGDDIFNVTMDGTTSTYTYTEGEYGSRMNVLNLEGNNKETFGVYHLSGTETVGYVIQPKGPATWENDGTRIQDGTYNTILGKGIQWPNYIGLDNKTLYQGSGVRVHYGTDSSWSSGCLLLSSSYSTNNGKHYFNIGESKETVFSFAKYMGATGRQQNVKTPGIKSNQNRRIDRFTWGKIIR